MKNSFVIEKLEKNLLRGYFLVKGGFERKMFSFDQLWDDPHRAP